MGSVSFDGVSFRIYAHDHHPPHAHGFYGSISVVVEFGDPERIGIRRGSVKPPNAKRNEVRKIVDTAVEHYPELMKIWRRHMARLSDDVEEQIDQALATARDYYDYEVAVSVEYDRSHQLLIVKLKSGQRLAIPQEDLQDLADADPDKVSKVQLEMLGSSLHWEELNVDFRVDGLRLGLYGSERWMKQLERRRRENARDVLSRIA